MSRQLAPIQQSSSSSSVDDRSCWEKAWDFRYVVLFIAIPVVLGIVVVSAAIALIVDLGDWLDKQGAAGLVLFIVVYWVWLLVFLPPTLLDLLAGYVYGFTAAGWAAALLGKFGGEAAAFWIGRWLAKDVYADLSSLYQILRVCDFALREKPYSTAMLIRFCALPIGVKNYGSGMLPCPFGAYMLGVLISAVILTVIFLQLGSKVKEISDIGSGDSSQIENILLIVGFACIIIILFIIKYLSNRMIEKEKERMELELQTQNADEEQASPKNEDQQDANY
jgi:uncharacterized membrane protein YdjX (TVP38/TMEM64 family)